MKIGAYVENTGVEIIDITSNLHWIPCWTHPSFLGNVVRSKNLNENAFCRFLMYYNLIRTMQKSRVSKISLVLLFSIYVINWSKLNEQMFYNFKANLQYYCLYNITVYLSNKCQLFHWPHTFKWYIYAPCTLKAQ